MPKEQQQSHYKDFREIIYLGFFLMFSNQSFFFFFETWRKITSALHDDTLCTVFVAMYKMRPKK